MNSREKGKITTRDVHGGRWEDNKSCHPHALHKRGAEPYLLYTLHAV